MQSDSRAPCAKVRRPCRGTRWPFPYIRIPVADPHSIWPLLPQLIGRLLLLDDAPRVPFAHALSAFAPGGDPANLLSADELPLELVRALRSLSINEDRLLAAINLASSADEG